MRIALHLLLSFLACSVNAYQVTFYAGWQCRGERLGAIDIQVSDGCVDASRFNPVSQSATIRSTPGDDPSDLVLFNAGPNCAASPTDARGNVGCIAVGAGVNDFTSINVVGGTPRPPPGGAQTSTTNLDEMVDIQHGDFFEHDGEIWRWRQIAQNAFTGVLAEEWTDSIVALSLEPLEFGRDYPFNFTAYYEAHPEQDMRGEVRD